MTIHNWCCRETLLFSTTYLTLHVNVVCECPLMMKSWSKSPIGLCIQTLINLSLPRPFCTKNVRIHISLQKLHFVQLDLIQFCSLEIFIFFFIIFSVPYSNFEWVSGLSAKNVHCHVVVFSLSHLELFWILS